MPDFIKKVESGMNQDPGGGQQNFAELKET
jgi:hypothetical protein